MRRLVLALCLCLAPLAAPAVQPDEVLDDPALEERAREISEQLRCMVCRNESIDESNADLARDMRLLVRERLKAGDSDAEVIDYIVDRYGEYTLLEPNKRGANLILWLSGPALALVAGGVAFAYIRTRRGAAERADEGLSAAEAQRLREILRE